MRPTMSLLSVVAVTAGALAGSALPASAAHPGSATVKAVLVKSYSNCGTKSEPLWDELNANWSSYGSIKVDVDYTDQSLCGDSFTLADLEASKADVVILDDPSGFAKIFSPEEVSALQAYASEGHDLIGTYLTFAWSEAGVDNSSLAPLFGLPQDDGWTGGETTVLATYALHKKMKQAKALFKNLPKHYASTGYNASQTPEDGTWDKADLAGARIVASNADRSAAITLYRQGSYNAIYIANMPEYGGGGQDAQFLYNAIVYPS